MPQQEFAQITLATPAEIELGDFVPKLAAVLDSVPVTCVRISLSTLDASIIGRAADQIRDACHTREVAVVIDGHFRFVAPHGLDGVHLDSGERQVRLARETLGAEAIIGSFCKTSKHAGMNAAEAGADYVSFGPVGDMGELGDGQRAGVELFQWWSEMIEVPVVAEGALDDTALHALRDYIDFATLSDEIWRMDNPAREAVRLLAILRGEQA